jgi:transposase-like protein
VQLHHENQHKQQRDRNSGQENKVITVGGHSTHSNAKMQTDTVTCKICKTPMKELKGHIYHKKRKWKCPKCGRVRMQEHK